MASIKNQPATAATAGKRRAFLRAYAGAGNVTAAAKIAGIDRHRHYEWMAASTEYQDDFAEAYEQAVDMLETEARRRAIEGVDEPVGFYKGQAAEYVKRYSDTLLIFLLKGARPEKYRERFEHTGPGGAPLTFTLDLGSAIAEARGAQLAPGSAKMLGPGSEEPEIPTVDNEAYVNSAPEKGARNG